MLNIQKLKKNKLFKNSSIFVSGKIIGLISAIFLLPLFTKKLPQSDFGVIGILWLLQPILSRLINLGADVAVSLKFFKVSREDFSNKLYHTLLINLIMLFFLILIIEICNLFKIPIIDASLSYSIVIIFIASVFLQNIITIFLSTLVYCNKPKFNVIVSVVKPLSITLITFYLVMNISVSYKSYIIAVFISNTIFAIISLQWIFRNFSIKNFAFNYPEIKQQLKVGLPIIPATIGTMILTAGDRVIIKYFIGLEAVGLYTYGYRFSNYLSTTLIDPFQKALSPIILDKASNDFHNASKYSEKLGDIVMKFFPIIVAFLIIPTRQVMLFLSNETYDISYYVFLIALPGVLILTIMNIYLNIFNHLERTDLGMKMVLIGAFINTGLNLLLIPKYGIIAASITTTVSYFIMFLMSLILLNKFIKDKIKLTTTMRIIPFLIYILIIIFIDLNTVNTINRLLVKLGVCTFFAYLQFRFVGGNGKKYFKR